MAEGDLLTLEFAQQVNDLMREFLPHADDLPDAQVVARTLHKKGVGLVDTNRARFLVDQTVHEGVLYRLRQARERADQAEALLTAAIDRRARELFEDSWAPREHGDAWNWPVHQQDGTQDHYRTLARAELTKTTPSEDSSS